MSVTAIPFPPLPEPARKPRVWTVFVALLAAVVGGVAFQMIAAVFWALGQRAPGPLVESPALGVRLLARVRRALALAVTTRAGRSRQPLRDRRGLGRPALPAWGLPVIMLGSVVPLAAGAALSGLIALSVP